MTEMGGVMSASLGIPCAESNGLYFSSNNADDNNIIDEDADVTGYG
jgi:hypothetical protein